MRASIAVVVVRWRGGDEVDRCLRSVLEHGGPRVSQVMLVDSGSADGGAERLAASFPDITVLPLTENRSFAYAANQGVAASSTELVLLLNPDVCLHPGCLDCLADHLAAHPRLAGAVPLLRNPDGSSQHQWQLRRLPTPWRLATGRSGAPAFAAAPLRACTVLQPAAAAWLLRRSVWDALAGFDPDYAPAWWEDVDLCRRLEARRSTPGFPAIQGFQVVPDAQMTHEGGSSLANLSPRAFGAAYYHNLLRYSERFCPSRLVLIRVGLCLSLLIKALRGADRAAHLALISSVLAYPGHRQGAPTGSTRAR